MPLQGKAQEIARYLNRLGFSSYEAKVYLTLAIKGALNPTDIANLSGVPRPNVYRVLDKLEREGYVLKEAVQRGKYLAIPIKDAVSKIEETIKRNKEIVEKLKELTKDLAPADITSSTENVWLISGTSEIKKLVKPIIEGAKNILVILAPERFHQESLSEMEDIVNILDKKAKAGVKIILGMKITSTENSLIRKLKNTATIYNWIMGEIPIGIYSRDGEECLVTFIGKWAPMITYNLGLWIKNPAYVKPFEYLTEKLLTLNTPLEE
ncbi:MAG: TrmB family transcriptional regulator [Candidatus Odinarchaeia archaeon]